MTEGFLAPEVRRNHYLPRHQFSPFPPSKSAYPGLPLRGVNSMLANTLRTARLPLTYLLAFLFISALLPAQDHLSPPNVIPQGTIFLVQLTDRIDTHKVKAGDHFHARLA